MRTLEGVAVTLSGDHLTVSVDVSDEVPDGTLATDALAVPIDTDETGIEQVESFFERHGE